MSVFVILYVAAMAVLVGLAIYVLVLASIALRIYIRKNRSPIESTPLVRAATDD
jgi:hypothetical protein